MKSPERQLFPPKRYASPQPPPKEGEQACASSSPPSGELEGAWLIDNYLRTCYVLEAENLEKAQHLFIKLSTFLQSKNIDEAMINVFCWYDASTVSQAHSNVTLGNRWITAVFPRKAHRPAQFFADGEDFMLISPGAIDMAGILVLPREVDFERISAELIEDIMSQVSFDDDFCHCGLDPQSPVNREDCGSSPQ